MKKFIAVIAVLVLTLIIGCDRESDRGAKPEPATPMAYKNITAPELKAMLEDKDFFLVDVHIPEQKHIAKTDLVVPFDEIDKNEDKFPSEKEAKMVLYCRSGSMSMEAAERLNKLGYKNIYNLEGGANAWSKAGYQLE